jgi:hypothetical protein
MRGGTLGRAIGRVDVSYPRRIGPTPGSIIAGIRPELARFGAAAARIEHGRGGLVRKQLGRGLQVVEQPLVHRAQVERGPPHPVSQGGAVEPETLTGVDLRLPVERESSGAAESHRRALPEPYVNLSAHTAPSIRPFAYKSFQCAKSFGVVWAARVSQARAPRGRCRKRLSLRCTHLVRWISIRRKVETNADR